MADTYKKISDFSTASAFGDTDLILVSQNGQACDRCDAQNLCKERGYRGGEDQRRDGEHVRPSDSDHNGRFHNRRRTGQRR